MLIAQVQKKRNAPKGKSAAVEPKKPRQPAKPSGPRVQLPTVRCLLAGSHVWVVCCRASVRSSITRIAAFCLSLRAAQTADISSKAAVASRSAMAKSNTSKKSSKDGAETTSDSDDSVVDPHGLDSAVATRGNDEFGRSVELLTVTITQMPLGIGFCTTPGPQYLAVHRFNPDQQTGLPLQAERSGVLCLDQLVVVGDIEVQPFEFENVVKLLQSGVLPMRLQFLRTTPHRASVRQRPPVA